MSWLKPRCSIMTDWSGSHCGQTAISRNDYGGFECEFHSGMVGNPSNPTGPYREIRATTFLTRIWLLLTYWGYRLDCVLRSKKHSTVLMDRNGNITYRKVKWP